MSGDSTLAVTQEVLDHLDGLPFEEREREEARIAEATRATLAAPTNPTSRGQGSRKKPKGTQAQLIVGLAEHAELFHAPDKAAYATVQVDDHSEVWPVRSQGFRRWLIREFYRKTEKPPGSQALQESLALLEARAQFDGDEHAVHVRVAEFDRAVYLDLCNAEWEVVEVTPDEWRLVAEAPVRFRRSPGMQPLPHPQRGGSLDKLRGLLNVPDEVNFILAVSWLVGALSPRGPYPVGVFDGEQGSCKSSAQRMMRALIDPSIAPLRTLPRTLRDLAISAQGSWTLAFDNLSHLSAEMSDGLCRLSSGGGLATRTLYTDDDEKLFDATRPVLLNSIGDVITRADLMDRSIRITLPPIPDNKRRTERDLWREFEQLRPELLGCLLDAVKCALSRWEDTTLDGYPRMADFARWVVAAEDALPWEPGEFMAAYTGNRVEAVETALESDPIAVAVRDLVETDSFEGTMTTLLRALNASVDGPVSASRFWPTSPRSLANRVRRAAPLLRSVGVDVAFRRSGKSRLVHLENCRDVASQPSQPSREVTQKDGADASATGASDGCDADDAGIRPRSMASRGRSGERRFF